MGIFIASIIIMLHISHLLYILTYVRTDFSSAVFYAHVLIQAYLYTGLFITAHDAIHGTITAKYRKLNNAIGAMAAFLYAGFFFNRLKANHNLHHKYPAEEEDPDFNIKTQNFFIWWGGFFLHYASAVQILIMAAIFNILKIWFAESSIWMFWALPAFLSSFQLFYFGVYQPHRNPHTEEMKPHNSRTQKKNHLWAMVSCYFFGYHMEHHISPGTPWWKLYKTKDIENE